MPISKVTTGSISDSVAIDTDTLVVDGTNNRVGIRTSSPERDLHIKGASGDPVHLKLEGDPADYARIMFDDGTTDNIGELRYNFGSEYMSFNTNAAERARIDSSGNLLVGTTDTVPSNNGAGGDAGVAISPDGVFRAARSGNVSLDINRMDSDGDIAAFRKDGSTVGSVGVGNGSSYTYIGTGDTGLMFNSGNDFIQPWNPSTNANKDNGTDLGRGTSRWKNLFLSGGVYLGGTGSANLLDDYEEGTWLGTLKGLTSDPSSAVQATGTYTKIGRTVHVEIKFSNVSNVGASGNVYVIGIPYMPAISYASSGNCAAYLFDFPNGRTSISVQVATSGLFPYVSGDSLDWDILKHAPGTGRYLEISAQYIVA